MEFNLTNLGFVVHQVNPNVFTVAGAGLMTPKIIPPSNRSTPLPSYNPPFYSFPVTPPVAPAPPPQVMLPIVLPEPTHPIVTPPEEVIPAVTTAPPVMPDMQSAPTRPPQPPAPPSNETLAAVSQSIRASRTRPIGTIPPR
jgi:hypothetical protein